MTRRYLVRMADGKVATCIAMNGETLAEVEAAALAMFGAERVKEVNPC